MNQFLRIFVPKLHIESPVIIDILDHSETVNESDPTILLQAYETQEKIYFITEGVIRRYSIEDIWLKNGCNRKYHSLRL